MKNNEKRVIIRRVVEWVHPYFGNRHFMPYGKLEVTDGETTKIVKTKGDTLDEYDRYGCQYITFNRKPYRLVQFRKDHLNRLRLEPIEK